MHIGLKRPRMLILHQVHSLKQFLVLRCEPLNRQLHEATHSQICHHFGLLHFTASPSLKQMVFQQRQPLWQPCCPPWPLDIIVVPIPTKNHSLYLPNQSQQSIWHVYLANFFVHHLTSWDPQSFWLVKPCHGCHTWVFMESKNSSFSNQNFNLKSQFSKLLGTFGTLAPKFVVRLQGAPSTNSSIFSPNNSSSSSLWLKSMMWSKSTVSRQKGSYS